MAGLNAVVIFDMLLDISCYNKLLYYLCIILKYNNVYECFIILRRLILSTGFDRLMRRPMPPDDRVSSIRLWRFPVQCRTIQQPRP